MRLPDFRRRLPLLLLTLLLPLWSPAATVPVSVGADTARLTLNGRLDWWPAAAPSATLDQARAADAAFVPAPARAAFGWRPEPLWFRVSLANASPAARSLVLEIAFANLDEVDLYVVRGGVPAAHWQTGLARDAGARALSSPHFVFPVPLAAGETATLYLRVASSTVLNVPLTLYDERAYVERVGDTRGWQGLFYGLVLGTLLCAAFLWRTTGDPTFRHYTLAVLLAVAYFLGMDGYPAVWWPSVAALQPPLMLAGATLSVTFTLYFARAFLDAGRRVPHVDRWLLHVARAAAVAAVLVFLVPPFAAMLLSMLFSIAMAAVMLAAGVAALRTGFLPARLLLLAMGVHIVSISLLSFSALAEIPRLFEFADNLHRAGFIFLLVCLTIALGHRIRARDEDRRRAEESVLKADAENRARNEFLSRMSHELRTPMTGVLGMAELLDHTDLDGRQRRYLATLRYSGELLLNLINDVLDHARIESGRLQVRSEAFDLLRLVDDCRMLFEQRPRDDGAVLRTDIGNGASRIVVGDGPRIRQVLVGVLMRAFRYAAGTAVDLRVHALDTPGWLRLEVACAGSAAADGPGGGEALATARRLCEMMGGSLTVQAAPGAGTLYRVDLPLSAAA
ncbi:MAG: 7TM-DISM domain-containing protein [Pseudomonadota bacterium]